MQCEKCEFLGELKSSFRSNYKSPRKRWMIRDYYASIVHSFHISKYLFDIEAAFACHIVIILHLVSAIIISTNTSITYVNGAQRSAVCRFKPCIL